MILIVLFKICQNQKFPFSPLDKAGRAIIVTSLNLIVHKYHDGEKFVPQTLQRVAGRCEAMQSGTMSLAPE